MIHERAAVQRSSFHSSFHAVVNRLVKNCHKEICIVPRNAHGRFDAEGLKWREEHKRGQIWNAGKKHTSPPSGTCHISNKLKVKEGLS